MKKITVFFCVVPDEFMMDPDFDDIISRSPDNWSCGVECDNLGNFNFSKSFYIALQNEYLVLEAARLGYKDGLKNKKT